MSELVERRQSRSPYRGEAADLYLRALSQRHGLGAVVVADELGLPIAASGPARAREVLSAYGALRAAAAPSARAAGETGGPVTVALRLGACRAVCTCLGGGELPWDIVAADLVRILDLGAPAPVAAGA